MIKAFLHLTANWLDAHGLYSFVMIFEWVSFRAVTAAIFAFLLVIIFAPRTIRWLIRQKVGDVPEFYNAQLNEITRNKRNTPTMGGVLVAGATLVSTLVFADLGIYYVIFGLIVLIYLAVLGGIDDWLKLTSQRRGKGAREGLYAWEKLLFQLGIGVLAGIAIYQYGSENAQFTHMMPLLPGVRAFEPDKVTPAELLLLPAWLFAIIAMLFIAGGSNAVNLTDGMDGLAPGISAICSFALMILCIIAGEREFAQTLLMPWIPYSSELAVLAGAMAGACLGFLWFNCAPAQVFMGDTGSLALGGLLGYIAVVIRQEFLLLLIGGVFVMEMMSVVLQVGYFKITKGSRIFRMAPIHHHFHLLGWTEQQVVVRFWLLTALFTAVALATLKIR